MRKTLFASFFLAAWAAFGAVSAWAYIPPSPFLIKTLARKHSGFKTIVVRARVSAIENGQASADTRFKEVTLFTPSTGILRSWAMDSNGKVLYVVERAGKNLLPASEIFFDSHPIRLTESLKAFGIPILAELQAGQEPSDVRPEDKTALRRWNESVAWVVGDSTQLWLEKDSFLPLRLTSSSFDLQADGFRSTDEFPYPRNLLLFQPGKKEPFLKSELTNLSVDHHGGALPQEKGEGFTEAGNSASSSVRDLISTYYRLIR